MKKIIIASGVFVLALFFTATLTLAGGMGKLADKTKDAVDNELRDKETAVLKNTTYSIMPTKKLVIHLGNIELTGVLPNKCIYGSASYDERFYSVNCPAGYTILYLWECYEGGEGREINISEKFTNVVSTSTPTPCLGHSEATSLTIVCCPK